MAGVLFAQVKKGALKYLGIAESESIAPGVNGLNAALRLLPECASMADILKFWEEQLGTLAAELKQGHASVSPISIHTSCRYCDFKPLCRIRQAADISTDEAEELVHGDQEDES